ncbi:MAG: sulfatase family protein [Planctomycetota bacterium]
MPFTNKESCIEKYGKDVRSIRELVGRYWGLVTQVDRSVGAILKTLDDLGLTENTIVVYTSDHGDMMGSHHLVEKSVMYQEAVRIPWLMRIPQIKGRSQSISNPVSQIDMVPTLLDLMGVKRGYDLPGKSLVGFVKGRQGKAGDVFIQWNPNSGAIRVKRGGTDVFIQWNPNSGAIRVKRGGTELASKEELKRVENECSRAVISPDGWKLVRSDVDKSQLFNLSEDPGETTNLFDSGRHRDVISRLTKKIGAWQEMVRDEVKV